MREQTGWSEQDSATYRALAEIAVPMRREFLASLLCLLPFGKDESFRIHPDYPMHASRMPGERHS